MGERWRCCPAPEPGTGRGKLSSALTGLLLALAGRLWHRRGSAPYRFAERLFPSLLGSRVGGFAIRV
jgi:hypothetical protein